MGRARAKEEISAGGVVFRMTVPDDGGHRPLFLLIRDSYKNWGFPKGHVEEGERPEDAALREVAEEESRSVLRRAYQTYQEQPPEEVVNRLLEAHSKTARHLAVLFFA